MMEICELVYFNPKFTFSGNYPFVFDASAKTSLLQTDQYFQMHNAQYAAMSDPNNIMQLFMQQQQQDADAQAHIANLICSVRRDHLGKYQRFVSSTGNIFNCVFKLACFDLKVQFKANIDPFSHF